MALTKKIFSMLMAFAVAFTMFSCEGPNNEEPNNGENTETPGEETPDDGVLVLSEASEQSVEITE